MGTWKIIDASGNTKDFEDDYKFVVQQYQGAGMAPIENISTAFGLLDGSIFQRQRTVDREITLTGIINGSDVTALHQNRKLLINAVKPDKSASQSPFVIQYLGGASTVQASAYYVEGLSLGQVTNTHEAIALKFICYDPYFEKTTSTSATLTVQSTVSNANYIVQRAASGAWGALGTGMNNNVYAITSTSTGALVIGGTFTTASGATANRIVQWNHPGFSNIGAATAINNDVYAVAVGLDGFIYVAGLFTTASVSASRAARYSGTGWLAVSTNGLRGSDPTTDYIAYSCVRDSEGNIIYGGQFVTAGGVAACGIAKWTVSSSAFSAIANGVRQGVASTDPIVRDIALADNGDIFAVGYFNRAGSATGGTACRIAKYSQSASAWAAIGGCGVGFDGANAFQGIDITTAGTAFIGAGTVAGTACRMYTSDGVNLTSFGPADTDVYSVNVDRNNNFVYFGGLITSLKGIPVTRAGRIINNTPTPLDIKFPGSLPIVRVVHSASDGVLTVGFSTSGTASAAAVTTITNNGTATTYPILTACAPTTASAQLIQLVNYTTGDQIYFNLTLQPREIVTLDLRPGQKGFTSNFRDNLISTVLPGSNVATWKLIPGANNVSFFMTSGSGAAKLEWRERFWSIDV